MTLFLQASPLSVFLLTHSKQPPGSTARRVTDLLLMLCINDTNIFFMLSNVIAAKWTEFIKENWYAIFSCPSFDSVWQCDVLEMTSIDISGFLAFSAYSPFSLIHFFFFLRCVSLLLTPSMFVILISPMFPFADAQLRDSPPGRGRVQHRSAAQKPREEPQHGCPAARSRTGLLGYDRRGEQQLHQRCSRRQLPSAGCIYRRPSPSAGHHGWLLEACLRLRLHSRGHAQPAQPVKLCLGTVKVLYTALLTLILSTLWRKRDVEKCMSRHTREPLFAVEGFYFPPWGYLNFSEDLLWQALPSLFLPLTAFGISSFFLFG